MQKVVLYLVLVTVESFIILKVISLITGVEKELN